MMMGILMKNGRRFVAHKSSGTDTTMSLMGVVLKVASSTHMVPGIHGTETGMNPPLIPSLMVNLLLMRAEIFSKKCQLITNWQMVKIG